MPYSCHLKIRIRTKSLPWVEILPPCEPTLVCFCGPDAIGPLWYLQKQLIHCCQLLAIKSRRSNVYFVVSDSFRWPVVLACWETIMSDFMHALICLPVLDVHCFMFHCCENDGEIRLWSRLWKYKLMLYSIVERFRSQMLFNICSMTNSHKMGHLYFTLK